MSSKIELNSLLNLESPNGSVMATYVWIDGSGEMVRDKTRTLKSEPKDIEELPIWNFDGSSTGQAPENGPSDVYLYPVTMYRDPFMRGNNKLVLCETRDRFGQPTVTNLRSSCHEAMTAAKDSEPWFGIEQEYSLLDVDMYPLGWPKGGEPAPQGPYYCGVGATKVHGRDIVLAHYQACVYAGINISGTNAEVMLSQWEYQVGPCLGIEIADQMWMSRYILHRVAEMIGVVVTLDPKPVPGKWNGAGAHTNYSTLQMRCSGGMKFIEDAIEKLSLKHAEHLKKYDPRNGEDNKRRLTGRLETSSMEVFSSGIGARNASVRIPLQVAKDGYGYLEDRRPSSNCDPYAVTEIIVRTTLID